MRAIVHGWFAVFAASLGASDCLASTRAEGGDPAAIDAGTPSALSPSPGPDGTPAPSPAETPAHDPALPPGQEQRALPDGLEAPSDQPWLWLPRVLLFPLYVASEFLVRRPLGVLLTLEEKYHLHERYYDLLTFGPEHAIGIFPTARLDLGQHVTLGAFAFWNDVGGGPSDLRLEGVTGGLRKWNVTGAWRYRFPEGTQLAAMAAAFRTPDRPFHGFGPSSPNASRVYDESAVDVRTTLSAALAPNLGWNVYGGHQWKTYRPAPGEALASPGLEPAPAFDDGFSALYVGVGLGLDTRRPRLTPAPRAPSDFEHRSGTGIALDARFDLHEGLRPRRAAEGQARAVPRWIDYGASLQGTVDLTGTQRRLGAELAVAFADPLPGAGEVPFSELVWLGGAHPLRGFHDHRLLDRSAAVGTLTYRWPIWVYLDGNLHYALGNVFGEHLAGFDAGLLRSSFGVGASSASASGNPFEALLAFGTRPLQEGGGVESVRFVFGTGSGM